MQLDKKLMHTLTFLFSFVIYNYIKHQVLTCYALPDSYRNENNNRKSADLVGAFSSGGGDCCPHVVDASFFVLTIGAIAVGTYLIQQRIIMDLGKKRRKKRRKRRSNLIYHQDICETAQCTLISPGIV